MKRFLLAVLFSLVATIPTQARSIHGGSGAAPAAPILQNAVANIGNETRTTHGGVSIIGVDFTTASETPQTFYGIDLYAGGTSPSTCTVAFVSGRSSTDFNTYTAQPCSTSKTPQPTSTGQNNLTGDYVFNVTMTDAGGNASNTVTLTYHTVNPGGGGAVNVGDSDAMDATLFPATFGNSTGAEILLSTGMNRITARFLLNTFRTFTNQVIFTEADITKPAAISNFQAANTANVQVQDIWVSGTLGSTGSLCIMCSSGQNFTFERVHGRFSEAMIAGYGGGWYNAGSCTSGCGMADSDVDYVGSGFGPAPNIFFNHNVIKHFYADCVSQANSFNVVANDNMCIAPMINSAVHTDSWQLQGGATPDGLTINGFWSIQADGDDQAQGAIFDGGGQVYKGHIAGGVITLTTGSFSTQSSGSHLYSDSGSPMAITDNVIMACASGHTSNCAGQTTGTVSTSGTLGSAGSPVNIYSVDRYNNHYDGMVYAGATFNGYAGGGEQGISSFKHFSYFQMNANPNYQVSYTGSASGSTLTVATQPVANIAGVVTPIVAFGGRLNYTGCVYCGVGIAQQLTGPANGIGTYQLSTPTTITSQTIINSNSYPVTGAAWVQDALCSTAALHGGTWTVDRGYSQNFVAMCTGQPNLVQTNVITSGASITAADYATGVIPQTTLFNISAATWKAMTPAQDKAAVCNAALPKVGGVLDLGDGTFIGAFTATGELQLDSGNIAIVGCGIH